MHEVVYADPPWNYHVRNRNGCIDGGNTSKYSTASAWELQNVRVPCAKDAVMFMWAVAPQLAECVDVMETWGFVYAGVELIWLKTLRGGRPAMGVGHYTASNVEFLLVGLRGNARHTPIERRFTAERGEHSVKPQSVRDHVVRFCDRHGLGRPLEMFARDTSDVRFDYGIGDQARPVRRGEAVEMPIELQERRRGAGRKRRLLGDCGSGSDANDDDEHDEADDDDEHGGVGFSLDEDERLVCLMVDASSPKDVRTLNVHGALVKDGFVLIRTTPNDARETIVAMRAAGLEFRTLMFFVYDPKDEARNELWLACAVEGGGARIKNVRKRYRSQLVTTSTTFPLGDVLRATREVFGTDARLGVVRCGGRRAFRVMCPAT